MSAQVVGFDKGQWLTRPARVAAGAGVSPQLTRWTVRMQLQLPDAAPLPLTLHVWGLCSSDATQRARAEFFGTWATLEDRRRMALRVLEVLQEGV